MKNLPAITLGDSDQLEVGDMVLAIGDPFGIGQTVTTGIVSALGRSGLGFSGYENFIQTDAAINEGNSGGALVDAEGRLVGINTAIISQSGGNNGIGFAVPVNMAWHAVERLISGGKVARGLMGVFPQDITPSLAQAFNLPDENGALIGSVTPNFPAEKAGIKSGDVITGFNGKKVTDAHALILMVSDCAPGTTATVDLIQNGRPKTISVVLAENERAASSPNNGNNSSSVITAYSKPDALAGVKCHGRGCRHARVVGDPRHGQRRAGFRCHRRLKFRRRRPATGRRDRGNQPPGRCRFRQREQAAHRCQNQADSPESLAARRRSGRHALARRGQR